MRARNVLNPKEGAGKEGLKNGKRNRDKERWKSFSRNLVMKKNRRKEWNGHRYSQAGEEWEKERLILFGLAHPGRTLVLNCFPQIAGGKQDRGD